MKLNETTLADVMTYMAKNMTDNANVDFDFKGHKARLKIKLVSREEEEEREYQNLERGIKKIKRCFL